MEQNAGEITGHQKTHVLVLILPLTSCMDLENSHSIFKSMLLNYKMEKGVIMAVKSLQI